MCSSFFFFFFFFFWKKKIEQKKNVFKIKTRVLSVCSLKENEEKGVFVRFLKENITVQRDVIVFKVCKTSVFTVCFLSVGCLL